MALRSKRQEQNVREGGRGQKSERTSQSLGSSVFYQGPEQTSARAGQHKVTGKGHLPSSAPASLKATDTLDLPRNSTTPLIFSLHWAPVSFMTPVEGKSLDRGYSLCTSSHYVKSSEVLNYMMEKMGGWKQSNQ